MRSPVERMRARLYVAVSMLVAANSAVFAVLHAAHLPPATPPTVVYVVMALGAASLSLPFLMRAGGGIRWLGPLFVIVFLTGLAAISFHDGGLTSGASYWLLVLPLGASFLGGSRLGWASATGAVVIGAGLYGAEVLGYEFAVSLSPDDALLHRALNAVSCVIGVAALAWLYEGPMVQHFRDLSGQLQATNAELETELAERRRAQRRAEVASQAKDNLLANLSHEFRTPISAILGGAELLRLGQPPPDPRLLDAIESGGQRLLRTLSAVLDLAWAETGGPSRQAEVLDAGSVVGDVVDAFHEAASAKGVHLSVRTGSVRLAVPRDALSRMASALVDNAVRFTDRGRVEVDVGSERGGASITVADTGVGMPAGFLDQAFEPFSQASEGFGRTHEGLGLGLTMVQQIAEALEGTVSVESAEGVGTTVRLWIPGAPCPTRLGPTVGPRADRLTV